MDSVMKELRGGGIKINTVRPQQLLLYNWSPYYFRARTAPAVGTFRAPTCRLWDSWLAGAVARRSTTRLVDQARPPDNLYPYGSVTLYTVEVG